MTIRYTCTGCGSVLKIKDEKAGTMGKCPKCKAEFQIPQEAEAAEQDASAVPEIDSVDMPMDLTPGVHESQEFDPLDVLGATPVPSRAAPTASGGAPAASTRKPSVAELMRDFEATKKKDKKSTPEISRPTPQPATAAVHSAGSAAEALSRTYQQKRDTSAPPGMRPQDVKEAEQRALRNQFLKTRALPAVAILSVFAYGWYWWINHETWNGPDLYSVTGQVLRNGVPAAGYNIEFYPIRIAPNGARMEIPFDEQRKGASGLTDEEGNFDLVYSAPFHGAPAGDYEVALTDETGTPVIADEPIRLNVKESGDNVFKIEL